MSSSSLQSKHYSVWVRALRYSQLVAPVLTFCIIKLIGRITTTNKPHLSPDHQYVFISNHPSYYDAPGAFSVFSARELSRATPIRFLTAGRFYYSFLRPLLAMCGCYPTKKISDPAYSAIDTTVALLRNKQNIYICPEGRRVHDPSKSEPRDGIIRIIETYGKPVTVILIHIQWKRYGWRPHLILSFGECNDTSSITKIMDTLYSL